MDTINLVNNGKPYFFRLDIAKESGQIARFTDWIKTRVSDNGKKVPIQWYDQGTVMNVHGFYPFIEGGVGKWIKDDDTGELVPSTDVVYRTWQGTPADTSDNGIAYYTLEDQFFTKQGEFVGTFGLRDDNGNNLTSVNLVFSVLGNDLRLTQAKDYYIKDLENLKRKFENDGNQAVADFNAKIEAGTKTDRQALDALRASIQANRDGQAAIKFQIDSQNIVTKAEHKNDIDAISDTINKRLAAMQIAPVGVTDFNSLIQKYPIGADGVFLTQDTKHIYTYINNNWQDLGVYQAVELDKDTIEAIADTKGQALGTELIPNGSFGTSTIDPVYPATLDTFLEVDSYLNREWLTITSQGSSQFKGACWNIDKQNGEIFGYPLTLSFDVQSAENITLGINFVFYDDKGAVLGYQYPKSCQLTAWKFAHYEDTVALDDKYKNCAKIVMQIITNDDRPIQKIMLTAVSLKLDFDDNKNDKIISNGDFATGSILPAYSSTEDTNLYVSNYLNRKWLTIDSTGISQYKGACWNIDKQNGEIFGYPLTLSFDVQSAEDITLGINFVFYDDKGAVLGYQYPKSCQLTAWRFEHYEDTIALDDKYKNCAKIVMQIITNDDRPIEKIMLTSLDLVQNFDNQVKIQDLQQHHHLPVMMLKGDLNDISGENFVKISWSFAKDGSKLSGSGAIKWQGSSSMAYPKKGYRLKTLKSDFKSKDKVQFLPSWQKHHKFNLKAYYTDGLMSRDPVNAMIGSAIWASQKNLPQDLIHEDNFGFIDGFPIALYINDSWVGIYSLNLPRPEFQYTKYAVIGNVYNELTQFKSNTPSVKLDGSDFESLNPDNKPTDDEKTAVNNLIIFVSTASDEDFKAHIKEHINLSSVIDYFIFTNIIADGDAWGKNQVLLSWDGKIWYWQPYDLDVSYSAQYDGSVSPMPTDLMGTWHNLFSRLNKLYLTEIKMRYTQIRSWLTPDYVLEKYRDRINTIGVANFKLEHDKWNNPAKDTEDFKQLTDAVYHQFQLLDSKWLI